jgi:hypothetical protein
MKLNVGCGTDIHDGYINIDNLSDYQSAQHFKEAFINEYKNINILEKYIENNTFIIKDAKILDYPQESIDEIVSYRFAGRYDIDVENYHYVLRDRSKLNIYCSKWNSEFFKKLTNTFDYIKIRRGSGAIKEDQDFHIICFKDQRIT